jgi:hypothetical protein
VFRKVAFCWCAPKPDDALDSLKKAVGDSDPETLDARACVVYGNICLMYGFESTAARIRERARSAKNLL